MCFQLSSLRFASRMKLVTTEPAINEKYDAEVLRAVWVGVSLGTMCGFAAWLPQAWPPQAWLPFLPQPNMPCGSVPFHSGIGHHLLSPWRHSWAATKTKGLGQAPTQFTCGPLSTLGFGAKRS